MGGNFRTKFLKPTKPNQFFSTGHLMNATFKYDIIVFLVGLDHKSLMFE
jgi:hypothetical protein